MQAAAEVIVEGHCLSTATELNKPTLRASINDRFIQCSGSEQALRPLAPVGTVNPISDNLIPNMFDWGKH